MASEKARILPTLSSTENHLKHDVFVLSPSSLQKLGIHLDSFQQGKTINSYINDTHIASDIKASTNSGQTQSLKRPIIDDASSQSSMSETANLMKTSVFLSPTFETTIDNKEIKTNCHLSYVTDEMALADNSHADNEFGKAIGTVESCKTLKKYINASCDKVDVGNTNDSQNLTLQSVHVLPELASTNTEIKSVDTVRVENHKKIITDKTLKDNNAQTSLKCLQSATFQSNNVSEIQEEKQKISSLNKGPLKHFVLVNLKGGSHTIIKDNNSTTKQSYDRNPVETYLDDKSDNIQSSSSVQHKISNNISLTSDSILQQTIVEQGIENPCNLDEKCYYIVKKSHNCKTFKPLYKKRKQPEIDIIKQNTHLFLGNELEINMAETVDVQNREESFCACFDFGYLFLPSDTITEYQHTHFGNKVSVESTLEELFVDKYDNNLFEGVIKVHNEDVEHNIKGSDFTKSNCPYICWKSLDSCSSVDKCKIAQDRRGNSTHMKESVAQKVFQEKGSNIAYNTFDNTNESVTQKAFEEKGDNCVYNTVDHIKEIDTQKSFEEKGSNIIHNTFDNIKENVIHKSFRNTSENIQNNLKNMKTVANDDLIPIYIVVSEDIDNKKSMDECNKTENSLDSAQDSDEELSMPLSQFKKNIMNQQNMESVSPGLVKGNSDKKSLKRRRLSNERPPSPPSKYKKLHSSQKQPTINIEANNSLSTSNLTHQMSIEINNEDIGNDTKEDLEEHTKSEIVCGVCFETTLKSNWISHIEKKHNYIAWKADEDPINVKDQSEVQLYLQKLSKQIGGLKCNKCGINRKYVKSFLHHVKNCEIKDIKGEDRNRNNQYEICGVCCEKVKNESWYDHIMVNHDYIAWKLEDPPLELKDANAINNHLDRLYKILGQLICSKCGIHLKFKNQYFHHFKHCSMNKETEPTTSITCGVCNKELSSDMWLNHIEKQHSYIAWKVGEPAIDINNDEEVYQHLNELIKILKKPLICPRCGLARKYVKTYLNHIKTCNLNIAEESNDEDDIPVQDISSKCNGEIDVVCGVCEDTMKYREWLNHLKIKHKYIAWRKDQQPLVSHDKQSIVTHLQNISDEFGCLVCPYCGKSRKLATAYQQHITKCIGKQNVPDEEDEYVLNGDARKASCCGVCNKYVTDSRWYDHIQKRHNYLAWKQGAPPLDIRNEQSIRFHLSAILDVIGMLKCSCGFSRKDVNVFSRHMTVCVTNKDHTKDSVTVNNNDMVTCALCSKEMAYVNWSDHSLTEHYNLAWIKGTPPIDYGSSVEVERFLKIYKSKGFEFVCKYCGTARASHLGFFAHVLTCNKTDEETDQYKNICEICNTKYLCIYRYQHMRGHELQQRKMEQKRIAKTVENEVKTDPAENSNNQRKAAQKAKKVIDLYNTTENLNTDCNISCDQDTTEDFKQESDSSSDESDISGVSEDVPQVRRDRSKKKPNEQFFVAAKTLPSNVRNPQSYLARSYNDLCNQHMSIDNLYSQWKHDKYEFLDDTQIKRYLPKLEESCNVSTRNNEWSTYKRFESRYTFRVFSVFLGGTPQCLAWAPPSNYLNPVEENQYLAVSTHKEPLIPSVLYNELYIEPNVIQIWNFHNLEEYKIPTLDLCIAHDYGIVWSMAWCPSGVRDSTDEGECRLGLLATACSNGYVYIYSVPRPITLSEVKYCKLKPVAELRLCSSQERKMYQPTKVTWSLKSGHSTVYVGYADGTVAFFDLNMESPILRCEENGVTILYPYHEDGTHSMHIQDISTYVCGSGYDGEALTVAAVSGITMSDSTGPSPLLNHRETLCPAAAKFLPHWPSIHIANSDISVVQRFSELEFGGGECRRVGTGAVKMCGCLCCGNVATVAPPFVRLIRTPHPVIPEYHKRIAAIINMAPLKNSSRKRVKDDMAVKIEPNTYDKVIKMYGLQFQSIWKNEREFEKTVKYEDTEVARFPLSDVMDVAFCPNSKHHTQLAIGTRSGFLFVTPAKHKYQD